MRYRRERELNIRSAHLLSGSLFSPSNDHSLGWTPADSFKLYSIYSTVMMLSGVVLGSMSSPHRRLFGQKHVHCADCWLHPFISMLLVIDHRSLLASVMDYVLLKILGLGAIIVRFRILRIGASRVIRSGLV